eukprot:TRINITY_DN1640_c0_g1_i3.p1 TRINITY_DN1640_c0_g1~~TRINITY_DN1640_c0_g1_i3.p1  ORF type:complete len:418 (+),score=46.77 TRINITY_DN1640_c0_g1_i3:50-1255(+)
MASPPWDCTLCTFRNSSGPTCEMCGGKRGAESVLVVEHVDHHGGTCSVCTFINTRASERCEMCDNPMNTNERFFHEEQRSEGFSRKSQNERTNSGLSGKSLLPVLSLKRKATNDDVTRDNSQDKSFRVRLSAENTSLLGQAGTSASNYPLADVDGESEVPIVARGARAMAQSGAGSPKTEQQMGSFSILTYNVWFREDIHLLPRISAIVEIIEKKNPDFVFLQEVTPNIYGLFQRSSIWKRYKCSVSKAEAEERAYFVMLLCRPPVKQFLTHPFHNSVMGRELCTAFLKFRQPWPPHASVDLAVATSHLESPCPAPPTYNQLYSTERIEQAKEAFKILDNYEHDNIVFGGDMNWTDRKDGRPPLPPDWFDVWEIFRPGEFPPPSPPFLRPVSLTTARRTGC